MRSAMLDHPMGKRQAGLVMLVGMVVSAIAVMKMTACKSIALAATWLSTSAHWAAKVDINMLHGLTKLLE
jgi:hypothetical protein